MGSKANEYYFLKGGGEMGAMIRSKDWSETSLGSPDSWCQSLRTVVALMLDNPFGMYIAWGNDYTQLYNDGYRPILGALKHPQALGISTRETFAEIWDTIGPMFQDVMNGQAVGFPDFMLPLNRNGFVEECYFDFSYSPIRNDDGEVGGVLVTVIETTKKKKSEEALQKSEQRFRAMADNIPNLAWMAEADGSIFWYNQKWYEYTGTRPEQMEGWGWQSVHDPKELPMVLEKWQGSIATGDPFEMVFPIRGADGKFRQFLTRVLPVKDDSGKIIQWFGSNTDITVQKKIELALKESEQRFRDTVKQAPVGITILRGKQYMVEMANDAYLALVDRKLTSFVGMPLFDALPEVEASVRTLLDNVLDTGVPFHGNEVPIPVNRYGKVQIGYFDFLYYPLREPSGEISGIIVTVTDVTEKVETTIAVKEKENLLQSIFLNAPVAIAVITGPQHRYVLANKEYQHMVSRTSEQLLGKTSRAIFPELVGTGTFEIFDAIYRTGEPFSIAEYPVKLDKNKDGNAAQMYFRFSAVPLKDSEANFDSIIIVAIDITEQVLARQKIEESEKRFRLLADFMPQHIWTSDSDGNLNYYNQSVFDYSGLTATEINKDGWIQIVHPDDRDENIKEWLKAVTTGNDFLFEHRFRRHDGEYRWQLSRAVPQKDEQGKIQLWVGTSTDIQDQKAFTDELEKQVQKRTKELADTNIELEKMNKELQSFAYISSHDLQEPLRKIQTFSSQIIDNEYENLSPKGKEIFQRMQNAAHRMQALINDLLSYSRTSTAEIKFETTHLNKIIQAVKEDLKEELELKHATIELGEMCEARIIPFQFRQLLINLVSNAIKFANAHESPHIKINSKTVKGSKIYNEDLVNDISYCHISIADNGIGFDQQYSKKIFELFQRLHSRERYNGTGIGLAIVKKIVENHNGVISAKSEIGKGATFDIYLPTN
ncbi:MAG: PAS domain-containing protein [Ferruginibacter sp.]